MITNFFSSQTIELGKLTTLTLPLSNSLNSATNNLSQKSDNDRHKSITRTKWKSARNRKSWVMEIDGFEFLASCPHPFTASVLGFLEDPFWDKNC